MKKIIIIFSLLFLSGCAAVDGRYISGVEDEIQSAIAKDLFGIVQQEMPAAKTTLTITPKNKGEKVLDKLARNSGYRVLLAGNRNNLLFDVYHNRMTDTYIGTISIGLYNRFNRQYKYYADGLHQLGTSIGN